MIKYIVENQVEQIKKKLDIVDVISRYLPLKKRGRHHLARCPFHNEKTPSFTVSPELQIFKCFGCGQAGDIFTFVQEFDRISFPEALEQLAAQAGITLKKNAHFNQADQQRKKIVAINHLVASFYHYLLIKHPLGKIALDYLQTRGIKLTTTTTFQLGFSPDNAQPLINFLLKKGYKTADLIATGTFGSSSYNSRLYDRFRGRLTFPLIDYRNRVIGFSGRTLPGAKTNLSKYINSPETDLYKKSQTLYGLNLSRQAIKDKKSVIVVEGEFDLISPFQAGFKNIVAIKGTAFTQDQLQLLKRHTDSLILALDSDFAGNNAAKKSIQLADQMDFDISVATFDPYKDPDQAVQSDPKLFKKQLKNSVPIWDFIINSTLTANNQNTIRGKKQILSTVLPFLVKITNSVIRSDYLKKLADLLGSDPDSLQQEASKYQPSSKKQAPATKASPDLTPTQKLEQQLLIFIFAAKSPLVLAKKLKKQLNVITTPKFKKILTTFLKQKRFYPKKFQSKLAEELQPSFQTIYLSAQSLNLDSSTRKRQLKKSLTRLSLVTLKKQLQALSQQISQQESSATKSQIKRLETKYNQLLQKISALQGQKT